jgi:hypothetical protein
MPIGDQLAEISRNDIVASAVKVAPPVSVTGATLLGYPIADWALWATLLYTLLQIVFLLKDKLFTHRKPKRHSKSANTD